MPKSPERMSGRNVNSALAFIVVVSAVVMVATILYVAAKGPQPPVDKTEVVHAEGTLQFGNSFQPTQNPGAEVWFIHPTRGDAQPIVLGAVDNKTALWRVSDQTHITLRELQELQGHEVWVVAKVATRDGLTLRAIYVRVWDQSQE